MAHVLAGLRRDDLHEGEEEALLGRLAVLAALAADAAVSARYRLGYAAGICALSIEEGSRAPLTAYDEALDGLWGTRTKPRPSGGCGGTSKAPERRSGRFHRPR